MGRQALLAVLCWLTLSETLGDAEKTVNSAVNDNVSAESAPRLYRNVPVGVYASAVPYASFSYRLPSFLSGPVASASRVVPVKETLVFNNVNGYLKDSYGNRFPGGPQAAAYKTTIPQQFVQLQELPAHLAQPLTAAAPNFQIKQAAPQVIFGTPFRLPSVQAAAPTPINHFAGESGVYAQNVQSLAPSLKYSPFQRLVAPQQQSTSNRAVYANTQAAEKYRNFYGEPKFQRLEERPNPTRQIVIENNIRQFKEEPAQGGPANLKASPDTQTYTTIVNGKKTVIELDTKPPVPLLDLTLLEPLTFDNPVVPQVQHFLPRINQATYQKLPEFTKQQKKPNSQAKKAKPKKKPKKPVQNDDDDDHIQPAAPGEPTITFEGVPNASPEFSYEINSPNYKETYKEQTLSYNKETTQKPVTYAYNHKDDKEPVNYSYGNLVQKEPVHYSYVHDSRHPGPAKEEYQSDKPKHLIYTFTPEEHDEDGDADHPPRQSESHEVGSAEVSDEKTHQPQRNEYHINHGESPRHKEHKQQHIEYEKRHEDAPSHKPHPPPHAEYQQNNKDSPRHTSPNSQHLELQENDSPNHNTHKHVEHQQHREAPRHKTHHPQHDGQHQNQRESPKSTHQAQHHEHQHHHEEAPRHKTHQAQHHEHHPHHEEALRHKTHQAQHHEHHHHHEEAPRHKTHQPQRIEYYERDEAPRHNAQQHRLEHHNHHEDASSNREHPRPEHQEVHLNHRPPQQHSQSKEPESELLPITQEYEEDIRILPTHGPNAAIQVDPNQHVQTHSQNSHPHPSPVPQALQQEQTKQEIQPNYAEFSPHPPTRGPLGPQPIVHEKSKRIIIQEETPDEMHSHQEQMLAEIMEQEENNEADFEKAYKNAAFGFPGFHKTTEDIEKDIYNPNNYGVSRDRGYEADHSAFQDYQAHGDRFPKTARLRYKDTTDDTKNDYYLDYLSHRPESLEDRSRKKQEYYKLYENYKPEKYFAEEKKEKQNEKYTLAPTFSYGSEPQKEETKKGYFAQYKVAPQKYEYSYPKPKPRDNSAFASRPYQRYTKTHFVEPQFQYGFEPIAIPRLLDSELSAMASNNSPESEKPAMRKKIYKENWYIKKTSTAGGDAAR